MTDIKINVEYLLNNKATAVHCATEDEARLFMSYLKAHYPNQCARWDVDETRFDECENGIGYTFYWNDGSHWRKDTLMFGSIESIRGDNYTVVDLCELMEEEKELAESDQPVESLFGGLM